MTLELLPPCPLKARVRNAAMRTQDVVEYEIWCRYQTASTNCIEWSVWRSYDQFSTFDQDMRTRDRHFAKMMVTVAFAPAHRMHAFFHQDQTSRFLEKRRKELEFYLQRVLMLTDVAAFPDSRGSMALAEFVELEFHTGVQCTRKDAGLNSPRSSTASVTCGLATSRSEWKQMISDEISQRHGDQALRRFKRRIRAFRKENDATAAANELIIYINEQFGDEFGKWVLANLPKTLKPGEKRALLEHQTGPESMKAMGGKWASTSISPNNVVQLSRRSSEKEILSCVQLHARGDRGNVSEFKRMTKALGMGEVECGDFVRYLKDTYDDAAGREILAMVAVAMPDARLAQELQISLEKWA